MPDNKHWNLYRYAAVVKSVYDGDTITLTVDLGFNTFRVERLRLNRINTPELNRPEQKQSGIAARDWLRSKLPIGKEIQIVTLKDKQEKYGRYLVEVHTDEGCLNDLIVHSGHAVYATYSG